MKFLRFILLGILLTGIAIWLINLGWAQFVLRSQLNREMERSRKAQDLSLSIGILEQALSRYPEAPNRRAAEQLLKTRRQQLADTTALSEIIGLIDTTLEPAAIVSLLEDGLDNYPQAANEAVARRMLTDGKQQLAETERVARAIEYAGQAEDPADGIRLLTQALALAPLARNRKQAEDLLATKKQQQTMDADLTNAMAESRQAADAAAAIRRLKDALAACPQSQYRQQAEDLLKEYQQNTDPLGKAITQAREAKGVADGIQILENAMAQYPASAARNEAKELLSAYKQQLAMGIVAPKKPLPRIPSPLQPLDSPLQHGKYMFYPPGKAPGKNTKPWQMLDSPLINRQALFQYTLEARMAADALLKSLGHRDSSIRSANIALRYAPRFTINARNHDLQPGSKMIVEYFSCGGKDKMKIQRAYTEQIPLPAMAKGQALTVDGVGVKIDSARARSNIEFYGAIVSLYAADGKLLMQKYSGAKLAKECLEQPLPDYKP